MKEVLLRTVHGSRLYGLDHAGSDYDFYEVSASPVRVKNQHSMVGRMDISEVTFSSFLAQCHAGIPQALEALYSRKAEIDKVSFFRDSFRVGTVVYASYRHAIRQCVQVGDFKRLRHATRLALNLRSVARNGSFNPTLSVEEVSLVNAAASSPPADFLATLHSISPVEVGV